MNHMNPRAASQEGGRCAGEEAARARASPRALARPRAFHPPQPEAGPVQGIHPDRPRAPRRDPAGDCGEMQAVLRSVDFAGMTAARSGIVGTME